MAVPDRNHRVRRAVALSFHLGRGSYALRGCIRYSCVYIVRMSPTLSGSSALQCVKLSDVLEIRNGIIFNFYLGLPHIALEPGRLYRKKIGMFFWTSPILDFCRLEIKNLAMISQDPYFLRATKNTQTRNWSVLLDKSNT